MNNTIPLHIWGGVLSNLGNYSFFARLMTNYLIRQIIKRRLFDVMVTSLSLSYDQCPAYYIIWLCLVILFHLISFDSCSRYIESR